MTVWSQERLALLRQRALDLRQLLDAWNPQADAELLAEQTRLWHAAQNQGLDAGYDPTYDPIRDPHRDPGLEA